MKAAFDTALAGAILALAWLYGMPFFGEWARHNMPPVYQGLL